MVCACIPTIASFWSAITQFASARAAWSSFSYSVNGLPNEFMPSWEFWEICRDISKVQSKGRCEVKTKGESDTKNNADVDFNASNPQQTGVYIGLGANILDGDHVQHREVLDCDSSLRSGVSAAFRLRARWWDIKSVISQTGLGNSIGRTLDVEVSKLGAIIALVTTSGLKGTFWMQQECSPL